MSFRPYNLVPKYPNAPYKLREPRQSTRDHAHVKAQATHSFKVHSPQLLQQLVEEDNYQSPHAGHMPHHAAHTMPIAADLIEFAPAVANANANAKATAKKAEATSADTKADAKKATGKKKGAKKDAEKGAGEKKSKKSKKAPGVKKHFEEDRDDETFLLDDVHHMMRLPLHIGKRPQESLGGYHRNQMGYALDPVDPHFRPMFDYGEAHPYYQRRSIHDAGLY